MDNGLSKSLILISLIILAMTTLAFTTWIPYKNREISKLDYEIDEVTKQLSIKEFNINHASIQMAKITATYGFYMVLEELKSNKVNEFKDKLKRQILSVINVISGGEADKNELEKLTINQLQDVFLVVNNKELEEQSQLNDKKISFESKRKDKIKNRDYWVIGLGIIQAFGLFIGILGEYLKKE